MKDHRKKSCFGFTLLEVTIIIGMIMAVSMGLMALINPLYQIDKAHDSKRKSDLKTLQKALEDYYNDKGCYPKPDEICYSSLPTINVCKVGVGVGRVTTSQVCGICGKENTSPTISSLSKLPCDPQHSRRKYMYEVEAKTDTLCTDPISTVTKECPQWYRIYSEFGNKDDPDGQRMGCLDVGACGLKSDTLITLPEFPYPYGFDFGVSSPNIGINYNSASFFCFDNTDQCNSCGAYGSSNDNCNVMLSQGTCKKVYPSKCTCCKSNGLSCTNCL